MKIIKKLPLILLLFLTLSLGIVKADYYSDNLDACSILDGASLIADDGTFLGYLSSNEYDSKSIANDYGTYGNEYNSDSIWNDYGTYGNEYNTESIWNDYATKPPLILKGDKYYGKLTLNEYAKGALNTFSVLRCFVPLSDDRYEPFMDLYEDSSSSYTYSNYSTYTPSSTTSTKTCGDNSSKNTDGKCYCDTGYTWEDSTDSKNLDCVKKTIYNTCSTTKNIELGSDYKCYCKPGYKWDSIKKQCLKPKTGVEICQDSYGINSTSNNIKNSDGTYNCSCNSGYEWNSNKTSCVIKPTKCGLNSFPESQGKCSCNPGYKWINPDDNSNLDCELINKKSDKQIKLENKIDVVFGKLKAKFNKLPDNKKESKYKALLSKLESLNNIKLSEDKKIIFNYLIELINIELNLLAGCDEVSEMLGLCEE